MVQGTQAQVAIIGGGIGGLTAAASLLRTGFEVQVYEQARSLGEGGAGISIGLTRRAFCIDWGLPRSWEGPALSR
jgi:salicylate hydroxylase